LLDPAVPTAYNPDRDTGNATGVEGKMAKLKIVESDLFELLEDSGGFRTGYIDKQTGEVLVIFDDFDEPEQEEVIEKLERDPDRYLAVEPIGSREGFLIMERFVESLPEGEERTLLGKVLSWKKPFSNFKSALLDMGDVRLQWFDYHHKELRKLAAKWFEQEEIDADLVKVRP
jgi:hypothetical protein